jgi:hypothetical protein
LIRPELVMYITDSGLLPSHNPEDRKDKQPSSVIGR